MNEDPSAETTQTMLNVACEAARMAGDLLLQRLGDDFRISKKGKTDLVTELDLESETLIVKYLSHHFPQHQILAEEKATRQQESSYKWIIDPLDGTTNYAHGYRFFCVSIALEVDGQVLLGVVFDPVTDELFTSIRGSGAHLNGVPIRVSEESRLDESLLCTGFSYRVEETLVNLRHFNRLILLARAVRRDGAAALDLCYVACGRFDGFWELSLEPWDVAAGALIVQEAGGVVTGLDGDPSTVYSREFVATNGCIHEEMVAALMGSDQVQNVQDSKGSRRIP